MVVVVRVVVVVIVIVVIVVIVDDGDDECERGDVTLHAKNEDATDYSMNESLVSVDGPGVEGAEETTVDGNADIDDAQDEVDKSAAEAEESDFDNDAMPDDGASFFQIQTAM